MSKPTSEDVHRKLTKKDTKDLMLAQIAYLRGQIATYQSGEDDMTTLLIQRNEQLKDMTCVLEHLEKRLAKPAIVAGRKEQVLKILKSSGHITVAAIATRIGISARNVSSQLTYLRKDGYGIATDSLGRKFLE